jgi:CRP-like cAMP-binding protein
MPLSPVRVQVRKGGAALRMRARPFRKAFLASSALQRELCRYAVEKLALARQSAACSRFHTIEARVARLLLMTADRVRCEEFFLTQAFLGEVLGERRVAVNEAAGVLQRRKLIGFVRGKIRILDRSGLEAASCRCYVQLPHGAGAESTVSHAVTA